MTVADDGTAALSPALPDAARIALGVNGALQVDKLLDGHRTYLAWHREHIFRAATGRSA